ncbi:hydrolase [Christensenellaceae bacterium]|uniref:VirB4 family type IV secretion system protein n=2 Tax=Clostridia TaxID=186801 RepID=UPI00308647FA|nr:hydrolase [Christensenellaceae bacterium]BDF61507.1 hydrolase [Christensenellaceae bacterium]
MTRRKLKRQGRKSEKLEFVQDYLPIKDLKNGIIETADGRYIKILEVDPINFTLRSDEEQFNIISSFASWLKISPMRLQFKSITRKADSDRHIAMVRKELEQEGNPQCREMGEDYIKLIKDVGSREALTRRFFLIFQYEAVGRNENGDYAKIYGMLQTAEQNARAYFSQCGNSIVQPKDPDEATAEILYMFFNRRSCVDEPFASRVDRVVIDTMAARKKVIGVDPVPHIRMAHFLAPRGIDLTHRNYIIMDGLYYSFLYIRANGFPNRVRAGWMSSLINAGEGIDVDVHLRRENRSKTIDKVAQRIRLNRTKLKGMQDTSTDYEELANSIQAGYFIKSGIANYNEDLFYMSVFVTVSAKSYEELMWRKQQMTDLLKSMDMYVSDCSFQQEAALQSVMPFLKIHPQLEKKAQRNVLTSGAASTYMFTSFEMSDDTGVLLGVNRHNNSLCVVDLFNTKMHKNANLNLLGTSGAGKTFTMQLLALRMRMRGIQCFILAPIKGHEFRRACNKIGGEFIKIAAGSPHCINVMEIRHTISPEMELIDEVDYAEMDSMLARKIQQLMTFFGLLVPDMSNEEEQMLDEALIKTYADFGITHDNASVYEDMEASPPKMKKMPILGDLHKHLQENPMTARLAAIVSRFVTGSAQSFNQETNVNLDNKYIVLDLSELKGKLLPVGMFIALDYVWDRIKSDRTKRKAIFIDEIWQLIGANSNRMAAEFCLEIFKVIRGFGGAAVSATQDLSDFFSLEDGRYGRAIINNSKNKIILNLEPDEAEHVQETLKLTRTEVRAITQFERGEALISSNNNKVPVVIKASQIEKEMITTDRAELEAILRERQKEKTHSA